MHPSKLHGHYLLALGLAFALLTSLPLRAVAQVGSVTVRVRTEAGEPVKGAVVKLLWGEASEASAGTDALGDARFSGVGQSLTLHLLPGASGVGMVNEEAERYAQPPLRFQVPISGRINVFVDSDGWVRPDAGGDGPPQTPVVQAAAGSVAHAYTQNEANKLRGLPTISAASIVAEATAEAEAGLDSRTTDWLPSPTMPPAPRAIGTGTAVTTQIQTAATIVASPAPVSAMKEVAANNTDAWGMLFCLAALIVLGLIIWLGQLGMQRQRRMS